MSYDDFTRWLEADEADLRPVDVLRVFGLPTEMIEHPKAQAALDPVTVETFRATMTQLHFEVTTGKVPVRGVEYYQRLNAAMEPLVACTRLAAEVEHIFGDEELP